MQSPQDLLFHTPLPQDLAAENCVLGSLLAGFSDPGIVFAISRPEDFAATGNRTIAQAISEVEARGDRADRVNTARWLHERGWLERAGGMSAIAEKESGESVNIPGYVEQQARVIRDRAVLRKIRVALAAFETRIDADGSTTPSEMLGSLEALIEEGQGRLASTSGLRNVEDHIIAAKCSPMDWLSDATSRITVPNPINGMVELFDGVRRGEMVVIAGRPGHGKSALANQFIEKACESNVGVALYNLEMPSHQTVSRLVCARADVNGRRLRRGELDADSRRRVSSELNQILQWPLFLADSTNVTVAAIRSTIRPLVAAGKVDLLVIDYLGLLVGNARTENRNQELSEISRGLKRLARELNIPVIALHQLNRDSEKRGGEPRLSDLRDSGSIEQDADVAILIHAKENEAYEDTRSGTRTWRKPCDLIVAKQRNGPVGTYRVEFVSRLTKFEESIR